MRWNLLVMTAAMLVAGVGEGPADIVVEQWGGKGLYAHTDAVKVADDGKKIEVDLSGLPGAVKIVRARLLVVRDAPALDSDDALIDPEISLDGKKLDLLAPWYNSFAILPAAIEGKKNLVLTVIALPGWLPEKTALEIAYEGKPAAGPPAVKNVRAVHHAGQTFITWDELDRLLADAATWGQLKDVIDKRDQDKCVRYRVYAADKPITAAALAGATLLAEVEPLSGWNVNGRSPDQSFVLGRRQMLDDLDYAKKVSSNRYTIPPTEADNVIIDRFVIPGADKPLPNGTGLYVHNPKTGRGYYAVTAVVNGREGTSAPTGTGAIDEQAGAGEPVFQREMDMKVLFDYPGRRLQYVQWTAPPLSNLPGRYYNWGVFVPKGEVSTAFALDLVLTGNDMYRRPRWPHRLDTVYVSPQDAPFSTWYMGYPESMGTLRGLRQGAIQLYTWRRMLAFVDWAKSEFKTDPGRVTCSGDRGRSATAALHFGMRNPRVFSLVYTCKGMPDPLALPLSVQREGRPQPTEAAELQRLLGRREWGLKLDTGQNVWEFLKLADEVAAHPEIVRPLLSEGGRGGWDWKPIAELLQACVQARQGVMGYGVWGDIDPPGVKNPGRGVPGLDVWLDRPMPVFSNCSTDYQGGRDGDGGSTNMWIWWDNAATVETADKLEMVLTGRGIVDVTPRRLTGFVVKPGQSVRYEIVWLDPAGFVGKIPAPVNGTVEADKNGLVTIPKVNIRGNTKLVLTRG